MDLPHRRTLLAGLAVAAAATQAKAQPKAVPGPWTGEGLVPRAAGRIRWFSLGEGPPVVLLHKLGGWSADWRGVAPPLAAKGRRVIAIDLPGHGDSEMLGPPPYVQTVAESAGMVKAALDEMGVDRFDIVGNSLGGCVGVVMAAIWPASVRKLALISTALAPASTRAEVARVDAERRAEFGPNWEPLPRTAAQAQRFGGLNREVEEEQNLSRAKAGVWVRPSERAAALAGIDGFLPQVRSPSLLILADRGPYLKFEPIARERLAGARIVKMADVGSFLHQEKPVETAQILNAFLG